MIRIDTKPPAVSRSGRESSAGRGGIHDRPVAFKLTAMAVGFVLVICVLMGLFMASLGMLTGVRAYVRAEALWTSGQKDAAFSLSRYAYTADPAHYQAFRESLERPLQHHIARTEMLKPAPDFDYEVARDALVAGGNSLEDTPYLIFAFRRLSGYGDIARAIQIWTDADPYILAMNELGRNLHRSLDAGALNETDREAAMAKLLELNAELTPREIGFSAAINRTSRQMTGLVTYSLFGAMVVLLAAAIYFAWSISRRLSAAVYHLSSATIAVGEGNLQHRVPVLADDELGRLSHAFNDMVAHRQRAEADEELRGEFMAAVLDNLKDAVVACDAQGQLSYFNTAGDKLLHSQADSNVSPSDWPTAYRLYTADGERLLKSHEVPLTRAFREETVENEELMIHAPDGSRRTVTVSGRALFTADGRKLGAVVAIHDVTERKYAEAALMARSEQLLRSNQELSQFAYVASHDLQEPLRTITSHTQMLVRRLSGSVDPEQLEFTHYIVEAALRMRDQIDGLLDYSREGRNVEVISEVDLAAICDRVIVDLSDSIQETAAVIERDQLPVVLACEESMGRLLQNLLSNAIKFRGDDAPHIRIWAERRGRLWQVSIRDNGIGIKPEYASRIFQLYQRLNMREDYPGNGLGLAICRKIVEEHGGEIWMESADPGAIFRFTLSAVPVGQPSVA